MRWRGAAGPGIRPAATAITREGAGPRAPFPGTTGNANSARLDPFGPHAGAVRTQSCAERPG